MVSRAEHRERTLLALSAATTDTIERLGPDATIDEIAERAGVARRTVYRWVDTRDDLLFIHPRLWIERFDTAVAPLQDEALRVRIVEGCRAVSDSIDGDPEPVRRAMAVALRHPELMRGYATVNQEWIDRMAAEVAVGRDGNARAERFRARALGAAIMGVIDAALAEWMASDTPPPLLTLVEEGLDHLAPILD